MTENCPFLPADETRAPVWPAAARFHAFEWLSALATTDGAPEEAGIALDTWHNTAMDLQDVKAGVVPQAIARAAFNSLDKDGFRAFVNDCKKAGFTVEFPICDATPQPLIERHIAAGQQGASIASQWWKRADETSENDPISRRHAMTLRQCATELAEHLATPQPAGCGACGDDCKDRGSCRLADESPKPAGAVPLPEAVELKSDGRLGLARSGDWVIVTSPWSTRVCDARYAKGWNDAREAAGRADAVPAWFGELPAPISNPEAWPANYAGGYNDALNMCYDVIRGHAPQQMTTQGEAVGFLAGNWRVSEDALNIYHDNFDSDVMLTLNGDFESCQHRHDFANAIARRLTGSQP